MTITTWQRLMEAARDRLLQDPFVALEVAILNKGFPEAEDVISQSPLASLCYAEEVLGARFRKGEATILTDPRASARYAATVLEGRWKEAEAVISQNADASQLRRGCPARTFPDGRAGDLKAWLRGRILCRERA